MFESIGPLWDGNEVWLVIAGGATFAAFPVWYATMFSGFYLALLLILVLLIVRVLSFEWRAKAEQPPLEGVLGVDEHDRLASARPCSGASRSRASCTAFRSRPTRASPGDFGDLFSAYTIARRDRGRASSSPSTARSSSRLRTLGDLRERAPATASRLAPAAAVVGAGFLVWTLVVASRRERQGRLPGHPPRRGRCGRRRRGGLPRARGERALGVRGHRDDDRRGRRHALRQPLPARDGLGSRVREQPHDRRTPPRRTTRSR